MPRSFIPTLQDEHIARHLIVSILEEEGTGQFRATMVNGEAHHLAPEVVRELLDQEPLEPLPADYLAVAAEPFDEAPFLGTGPGAGDTVLRCGTDET